VAIGHQKYNRRGHSRAPWRSAGGLPKPLDFGDVKKRGRQCLKKQKKSAEGCLPLCGAPWRYKTSMRFGTISLRITLQRQSGRSPVDTIEEKCRLLAEYPGLGTSCHNLHPSLRFLPVGKYLLFLWETGRSFCHAFKGLRHDHFLQWFVFSAARYLHSDFSIQLVEECHEPRF